MKILYAIQATGNGHISRANEVLPYFQQYGKVDVFLSGSNSSLNLPLPVKYRSKGVSLFYGNTGALDYWKTAKRFAPLRIINEAKSLPVEKYDVVISDFESITALACKIKTKQFIHFGHQASFSSKHTPRPDKKDIAGEFLLKYYAGSKHTIGLHFEPYDSSIFSPILKSKILDAQPSDKGHVTVYLCHYNDNLVSNQLRKIKDIQFHLFSKQEKEIRQVDNITIFPITESGFNNSIVHCSGIITGAGFETPSEALFMHKKLMCLPIQGQYEQSCNAVALKKMGVHIIECINDNFAQEVCAWLNAPLPLKLSLSTSTKNIVEFVMNKGEAIRSEIGYYPNEQLQTPEVLFT